jgi:hypothetical protein
LTLWLSRLRQLILQGNKSPRVATLSPKVVMIGSCAAVEHLITRPAHDASVQYHHHRIVISFADRGFAVVGRVLIRRFWARVSYGGGHSAAEQTREAPQTNGAEIPSLGAAFYHLNRTSLGWLGSMPGGGRQNCLMQPCVVSLRSPTKPTSFR